VPVAGVLTLLATVTAALPPEGAAADLEELSPVEAETEEEDEDEQAHGEQSTHYLFSSQFEGE
jgi:hypothetical protein